MKRTRLKAKGKVGRANDKARKMIGKFAQDHALNLCEMNLEGCEGNYNIAPAHRHKRRHYKGNADALADPKQWVVACQKCHMTQEDDRELTEEIFTKLRGSDNLKELLQ